MKSSGHWAVWAKKAAGKSVMQPVFPELSVWKVSDP
jgi:hypothetical protein